MSIRQPRHGSERFGISFDRNKPFDLVGLGMNAVDHLCVVPGFPGFDTKTEILHYELLPGGMVATAVVCAARMGLRTKYIGKVGSDALGQVQLDSLAPEGIDISSVIVEPGARNQYAFIITDRDTGERTILWERDQRLNFRENELKKEEVCAGRILHLDGEDHDGALRAATWAHEENIPVAMDIDRVLPNSEALISKIDFLIASANFPRDLTGIDDHCQALRALRKHCTGFLAVTLGADGVMALVGEECVRFPAYKVHAIDTTGAGDIFRGAFIYGLLQEWALEEIMRFANAAAGLSCTRLGARAGIPLLAAALDLSSKGDRS